MRGFSAFCSFGDLFSVEIDRADENSEGQKTAVKDKHKQYFVVNFVVRIVAAGVCAKR